MERASGATTYLANFRTRTPKGDGNERSSTSLTIRPIINFRTRTPKGDGNANTCPASLRTPLPISEHEPRKGTETLHHQPLSREWKRNFRTRTPKGDGNMYRRIRYGDPIIFQNTNPERGRKPRLQGSPRSRPLQFQNTNPERGRKLFPP